MTAVVDTLRLTAEDALGLVERGEVSPAELHARVPRGDRRARRRAPRLPAHGRRGRGDEHPDRAQGRHLDARGRDDGGLRILSGYVPVFDATVAARCKEAGLTLLGKTNTDEFAMGSSTENSAFGPSRNPWDPTRVPGGSGGGTAAAVSGGLAPWGLGSDTGGSIKQPSALCGNVGLRPTYGTVSRYGIVAFASSLDQVGPVAKTVRDVALLYRIISGRDPADSTTVELPTPVELPTAERLDGLRIGVPRQAVALDAIEPGVRTAFDAALVLAEELGADVDECDLPLSFDYGMPCYYLIAPAEASSNLARYDGVRYGPRSDGETYREMVERTRDEGFGDEPKRRIMLGTYALSAGYYDAYYGQAQKVRTLIVREHAAAFERFDVLATPTSPTVAFRSATRRPTRSRCTPATCSRSRRASRACPGSTCRAGSRRASRRPPADRAAVRREHALPCRARPRTRAGSRSRPGAAAMTSWEPVIGLEIHVQLKTRTKMFCRCPVGFGAGGEHADVPGLPRLPRRTAGAEPRRDRVGRQARPRARLRDRAAGRLRAQELLLPRPAEGLSDLPIRSTILHKWQYDSTAAGW